MNPSQDILHKIRRLEIRTKQLVQSAFAGQYQSVFKGQGMSFEEVRPYAPGDEIHSIDWNVSARTGDLHIKKFKEEREATVMILIDVSASGNFGSYQESKRLVAAQVAAVLAFSATYNNDKVGLLLFSDQIELFLPPKKGRSHHLRLLREMFYFQPKSPRTNIHQALEYLNKIMNRRAIVFIISDFLDNTDFERPLMVMAKRHDLIALPIIDPAEEKLPDVGTIVLEDPETGEQFEVNTASTQLREEYAETSARRLLELKRFFRSRRIDTVPLHTEKDYLPPLRTFFSSREKRKRK